MLHKNPFLSLQNKSPLALLWRLEIVAKTANYTSSLLLSRSRTPRVSANHTTINFCLPSDKVQSCDWVLVIWDVNRSGVFNVCFLPLKWLGVYSFLSLSFFHRPELEHGHVSQLGLYRWEHHGDRRATRWKEPGNLCDCQELRTPHTGQPTSFHTVMWKRNKPSKCLSWTPARFGLW